MDVDRRRGDVAMSVVMVKPVGPVCNLRCEYCYYVEKTAMYPKDERYRMREDVLEALIRSSIEAAAGPEVRFVWHGGEPTLAGLDFYHRVLALQKRHVPEGWTCQNSLQTNGTLIDERWARFIAENNFTVGLSIDGPEALHDAGRPDRRGRPTQARAVRALHLLREHGVDPDVLCTVNARTAAQPRELYRYFLSLGVTWLQFIPVVRKSGEDTLDELSVTPGAYANFLTTIYDEWVRYDLERITIQEFLIPMLVSMGRPAQLCVYAETCGEVLAVEHDGAIYSCDHFVDPAHRLGSVLGDGIAAALSSDAQCDFGAAKATLPASCVECEVLEFCRGGCPKDRFSTDETGRNVLCEGYREYFRHVRPYAQRMAELARLGRRPSSIAGELEASEREERRRLASAGRNESCPCGSGIKFKNCCMASARR